MMRKTSILALCALTLATSCAPRDFLTRRLAADLIAGSVTFRAAQPFEFRTGVLSNQLYLSPDYLLLQHRGWISSTETRCPSEIAPLPCWEVALTPAGVDTFQPLIPRGEAGKDSFSIPVARREFVAVTGIARQGNFADVEFIWRWTPMNEVGAVLYTRDIRFKSTVGFRRFDDGWRVLQNTPHAGQPLEQALQDAETLR